MNNNETKQVTMTAEELEKFEAFKAEQKRKEEDKQRTLQREEYAHLVDDEVSGAIEQLSEISARMKYIKSIVFDNFQTIIAMKREVMNLSKEGGQFTHTFTTSDSMMRITLGNRTIDDYRDSVEEGVQKVRDYLKTLAKDEDSADLVDTVMRLLARNKKGALQPSRIIQLRQLADKRKDEDFLEGVRIIEESYQPYASKTFIKAEIKTENGWEAIPLNITDC